MNDFKDGDVVIVNSGQAGTLIQTGKNVWVFLRNGNIWVGPIHNIRLPQDQADLDSCPLDVPREEEKRSIRS
jgi:hypothetical protein